MSPADDSSNPAAFVHDRRVQAREKQKSMAIKPDYYWCTYSNSKYVKEEVLPFVKQGLIVAAAKLRIVIGDVDLQWLENHDGRFMHFMHPGGSNYRKCLAVVKHKNKSTREVADDVVRTRHVVVGVSPRFSNQQFAASYFDRMDDWLGNLWNFLAIIGDYVSMLILLMEPPQSSPSLNFANLQAFVLHKFNQPLEPLYKSWDKQGGFMLDRCQRTILSEGNVKNHGSIPTLIAALNHIHAEKAKDGDRGASYSFSCEDCYTSYWRQSAPGHPQPGQYVPCHAHTDGCCRYCNRGNPYYKSSKLLITLLKYLKAESQRRQYQPKSKDGLLRSDFLDIHAYIKACHFKISDFANYTMCLGGTYYAGRFDSYSEVQLVDFSRATEHFSIVNNQIEHLAQQVFGKSDKHWHTYLLKFDDHCPQLCYLRHLLVFVHAMEYLGKPSNTRLFPDKESLMDMLSISPSAQAYTGDASYYEGLAWLKKRVSENLANPNLDVGMHSLRVTHYLWAVLCRTPRPTMKKNARHKSEDMVDKYEANSENVYLALLKNPELFLRQKLGAPQDVLLVTGQANQSKRVNEMNGNDHQVTGLPEAAKMFVEEMLHVSPHDPKYRNVEHLLELSYGKSFSGRSPANLNAIAVVESVPDQWRHHAAQVYSAYSSMPPEWRMKVLQGLNSSPGPHMLSPHHQQAQVRLPMSTIPPTPNQQPQPFHQPQTALSPAPAARAPATLQVLVLIESQSSAHSPGYHVSLTQHRFGHKSPNAQCLFLLQVVNDVVSLGKQHSREVATRTKLYLAGKKRVNPKDKSAFCRIIDPFFECLEDCCNSDIAVFINKHPNYKGSCFKRSNQCETCKGMLKK